MAIEIETINGWRDGVQLAKPINDLAPTELRYLQDAFLDEPTILTMRGPMIEEAAVHSSGHKPEGMGIFRAPSGDMIATLVSNASNRALRVHNSSFTAQNTFPIDTATGTKGITSITPGLKGGLWIGVAETPSGSADAWLAFWRGMTASDYATGTITVSRGSTAVTGSGTTWTSAMVGGFLFSNTDLTTSNFQFIGVVAAVNSTTSITLEVQSPFAVTARSYSIYALRSFSPKVSEGRITCSTTSAVVSGASTKFKDQGLATGTWDIYKLDNTFVGTVSSVSTNTGLTMGANAAVALSNERYVAIKRNPTPTVFDIKDDTNRVGFMTAVYANRQWFAHRPSAGVSDSPSTVWFSDTQDPEMVDLSAVDGDFVPIVNTASSNTPLMALATAHNALLCLKQNEAHGIFGSSPSQFNVKKLFDDGCLHAGSVQSWEGGVLWAGREGIYFYDGTQVENIVRDKLGEWYTTGVGSFDPNSDQMGSAIVNDHYLLHISDFVPLRGIKKSSGDNNLEKVTIAINLQTRAVTFLTNVGIRGSAEFPPGSSTAGIIGIVENDVSTGGSFVRLNRLFTDTGLDSLRCAGDFHGPSFYLESAKHSMGDAQIKKLVKQVQCLYKAVNDDLRLETIVGLNETATLSTSKFLAQTTFSNKRIKFLKRSQYLAFRIYAEDDTLTELKLGPVAIGFKYQRPGRV